MTEGGTGEGRDGEAQRTPDERELKARLDRLGEDLGARRRAGMRRPDPASGGLGDTTGFARGLRLSSEFVAAVIVGAGLGWGLDRILGVAPWGLIVFLMLGFAAGVFNVMRAAGLKSGPRAGDRNS